MRKVKTKILLPKRFSINIWQEQNMSWGKFCSGSFKQVPGMISGALVIHWIVRIVPNRSPTILLLFSLQKKISRKSLF